MNPVPSILFAGWLPIARLVVVGVGGYVFLLLALRTVGSRTMAKTNVFDFIILVSIGSVFGRILTAKDVTLVEACLAYALMVTLHYTVSWLRVRSRAVAHWLDADPVLLYFDDHYLPRALLRARIREKDIEAAARSKGLASMRDVHAVVLEPDGELSILAKQSGRQELIEAVRD
ncbi:MAG: DUF421 domain-containing protein [Betaproteobacteria bacterium]|jgi:uncharacterized membrane protein YcaP (DUF421 family)